MPKPYGQFPLLFLLIAFASEAEGNQSDCDKCEDQEKHCPLADGRLFLFRTDNLLLFQSHSFDILLFVLCLCGRTGGRAHTVDLPGVLLFQRLIGEILCDEFAKFCVVADKAAASRTEFSDELLCTFY